MTEYCFHGHQRTKENTYVVCKVCNKERMRRLRARQKAEDLRVIAELRKPRRQK